MKVRKINKNGMEEKSDNEATILSNDSGPSKPPPTPQLYDSINIFYIFLIIAMSIPFDYFAINFDDYLDPCPNLAVIELQDYKVLQQWKSFGFAANDDSMSKCDAALKFLESTEYKRVLATYPNLKETLTEQESIREACQKSNFLENYNNLISFWRFWQYFSIAVSLAFLVIPCFVVYNYDRFFEYTAPRIGKCFRICQICIMFFYAFIFLMVPFRCWINLKDIEKFAKS